jgi:hypothetical protein
MKDLAELIDNYFAMWNEPETGARQQLIAKTWVENGSYIDPLMTGDGQEGICVMVQGVQDQFPGHKFRRTGEIDAHHNQLRFNWELASEDGTAIVKGTDYGTLAADGRLQAIVGFFNQVPGTV